MVCILCGWCPLTKRFLVCLFISLGDPGCSNTRHSLHQNFFIILHNRDKNGQIIGWRSSPCGVVPLLFENHGSPTAFAVRFTTETTFMFLDLSSVKTYFFLQIIFLNAFSLQTYVLVDPFLTSLTDTRDQLRRHTTVVPPWSTHVILGSLCTETAELHAIMANGE